MLGVGFGGLARYEYSPIPTSSRSIRLLRLLPPRKALLPGFPVTQRIEIIQVDLDSGFQYDALSYCWDTPKGQTEPDRLLIVETKSGPRELRIFRPLELALSNLQPDFGRPLFVDQVCINQPDTEEKEHQVKLMRDVYSRCVQTIVWLGAGTRASDRYFSYMTNIVQEGILSRVIGPRVAQFMNVFDAVMNPTRSVSDSEKEDRDDILDLISRYGSDFPLDGLKDVLERKWFGRLWTIQEACLAPQVTYRCGNWQLCYDCFRSGLLFFHLYNNHWQANIPELVPKWQIEQRSRIQDLSGRPSRIIRERNGIQRTGKHSPLYDVILKYNVNDELDKIGVTLPVDRIFGLLGLTAEDDELRREVKVDYQVGGARVYTDVAATLMKHSVDTLLFSQFPKGLEGLPSWVPDFSTTLKLPSSYTTLQLPLFSAGGAGNDQVIEYDEKTGEIKLRGIILDRVVHIGQETMSNESERHITSQLDYASVGRFLDEAAAFTRQFTQAASPNSSSQDKELELQVLRLGDAGLSFRWFTENSGFEEGIRLLGSCHSSISKLGASLVRNDEFIASRHIGRIAQTLGFAPWYARPTSEWEVLSFSARHPIKAVKVFMSGAVHFLADFVYLSFASARISILPWYLRLRKRRAAIRMRPDLEKVAERLEKAGIDLVAVDSKFAGVFCANLQKNLNRRLYATKSSYLGLGPSRMRTGDCVVVFPGSTVPHILRAIGQAHASGERKWSYVGEAYCDGMMDGQAFSQDKHGKREMEVFTLI